MQLLHELSPAVTINNTNMRDVSSNNFDIKEKRSSDRSSDSLFMMNPVASGDNVAVDINANQKHKEEMSSLPPLIPCCEGKELQIKEDLVHSGLSAISVRHDGVVHCSSMSSAIERPQAPPGLIKLHSLQPNKQSLYRSGRAALSTVIHIFIPHRNSFRSLHRPDLKRVPYLRRLTPDELELLFRGYADIPARTKNGALTNNQDLRQLQEKNAVDLNDGNGAILHPIPETISGTEDVPAGMRLHGTRARLYTSVLAGVKTGDQLDSASANEHFETHVSDILPDEEIQLHEELQILLPPRCDDVVGETSKSMK